MCKPVWDFQCTAISDEWAKKTPFYWTPCLNVQWARTANPMGDSRVRQPQMPLLSATNSGCSLQGLTKIKKKKKKYGSIHHVSMGQNLQLNTSPAPCWMYGVKSQGVSGGKRESKAARWMTEWVNECVVGRRGQCFQTCVTFARAVITAERLPSEQKAISGSFMNRECLTL